MRILPYECPPRSIRRNLGSPADPPCLCQAPELRMALQANAFQVVRDKISSVGFHLRPRGASGARVSYECVACVQSRLRGLEGASGREPGAGWGSFFKPYLRGLNRVCSEVGEAWSERTRYVTTMCRRSLGKPMHVGLMTMPLRARRWHGLGTTKNPN